ncbi:acyl-CoA dehydrogenase [Gammaproteobacteria bacterium LSUCC0057]|uniref:3-methylmercaptopropionyl-CoA dehydrogenase n=1 Tax=Gammaproteobacteria bacterium LSUCC0057 TaxID=2559237 RepID=A0A4Y8UMN4_9GAMM|nr:acyl-CoA dehydrogenase [Gammaproteobacteria bacterium LSUCC0057]
MTVYKTPEKEFNFLLNEVFDYASLAQLPGFEDASPEMVASVLPEAAKFFEQIVAPTNQPSDQQGSKLVDGKVKIPDALEGVYPQLVEAGWTALSGDAEYGGAGFPNVVGLAVQEMLQSSNLGFSLMPMLTQGVVHALDLYGSDEQKQTYLSHLITGHWSGTMNLTEPQAGTDLGAVQTKAVRNGDTYLISGQKIYITWGDQEITENVIHLVLARTPDAPEGVKGISMFIVPKYLVNADGSIAERNDVKPVNVEHKLGIHSSPTCTMMFGEAGGATGYLVGEEGKGLVYMFAMMNAARLAVGHQGVAVSERAYQQAVWYARERVQGAVQGVDGRAAIIHHADVRRMLMQMRAMTEAGRALSFKAIFEEDRSFNHPDEAVRAASAKAVELLTPLVKGWCTEMAMETTSLGIQVHGGMGFVEETGAAQFMRDARILPIYEGTNGIQALDFIGRKTLRDAGQGMTALAAEIQADLAEIGQHSELHDLTAAVAEALSQCQQGAEYVFGHPQEAGGIAYNYMMLVGNSVCAWLLAKSAAAAQTALNAGSSDRFYRQKVATARFFVQQVLPRNGAYLAAIKSGQDGIMALTEEDFEVA